MQFLLLNSLHEEGSLMSRMQVEKEGELPLFNAEHFSPVRPRGLIAESSKKQYMCNNPKGVISRTNQST